MSSATSFNLDQSKILSSGNGLSNFCNQHSLLFPQSFSTDYRRIHHSILGFNKSLRTWEKEMAFSHFHSHVDKCKVSLFGEVISHINIELNYCL